MVNYIKLNPLTLSSLIISVGIFAYLLGIPFLDLMEYKTIDLRFKARNKISPGQTVVLAVVDEKSLAKEGKWVWPRSKIAHLISKLSDAGASVIALDIFFSEPDDKRVIQSIEAIESQLQSSGTPENNLRQYLEELKIKADQDQLLAAAIKNSTAKVVLGYFFQLEAENARFTSPEEQAQQDENILTSRYQYVRYTSSRAMNVPFVEAKAPQSNIAVISNAAEYSGTINKMADPDGVVRRLPAVFQYKGMPYAPLSLMAVSAYLGNPPSLQVADYGVEALRIGQLYIPTDELGRIMINYRGEEKTFPHISVTDILHDEVPKDRFKGKIVLVGATATGIYDLRVTPFSSVYPGIEIHANIIDSILSEDFLYKPAWSSIFDILAILVGGFVLGMVLPRTGVFLGAFSVVGLFSGYIWLCQYLFAEKGAVLNLVYPLSSVLLVYVCLTAYKYFSESKQKRFVRDAFSTYLAPAVVKQLMESPDKLKLGGEERDITAYFSDIQGFTSISEKLTPTELVELLNEFLTEMTNIILKYEGMVDKFEGDAIIALFGAPNDIDNHAEAAVKAAIDMQKRLIELREKWKLSNKPELWMRIGLYTGPAVVGNMGSENRMDYTMMGNTVNAASRLEGVNKIYGTYTMIGETTREAAGNSVFTRELDMVSVVGKHEPIRIYELIGYPEDIDGIMRETIDYYHKGLSAYRHRHWNDAVDFFEAALALNPEDKASQTMLTRCNVFKSHPPDDDWDGTYTMQTK